MFFWFEFWFEFQPLIPCPVSRELHRWREASSNGSAEHADLGGGAKLPSSGSWAGITGDGISGLALSYLTPGDAGSIHTSLAG